MRHTTIRSIDKTRQSRQRRDKGLSLGHMHLSTPKITRRNILKHVQTRVLHLRRLATSVHNWWFWWKRCRPARVFYPVITKPDSLILGLHQQTLATINSSIPQISRRVLQFLNTTPQLVIL